MSRSMLPFGSFIVGAICGSLVFSLIHTSTRVHAFQQPPQEQALPPSMISMPSAIPVVPPIQFDGHGSTLSGPVQQLDGFSCESCSVTVGVLTYGGGNFNFPNTTFPRNVGLHLTGAARNTFILLTALGVIPRPTPPPVAPNPGRVIQRTELEIKAQPSPITFVSLESVKK